MAKYNEYDNDYISQLNNDHRGNYYKFILLSKNTV
jgi:hypothetical protein